jgi:disease resistance protein RPS2
MCVTELALTFIGSVLGPICNLFCGDVSSKMTTTLNLRSNLDDMVRDMKNLMDRITEVKQKMEAAEKEGKDILPRVVTWLEDVEKLELKVNPIQEEKPSACFLNCSKRYSASREVEEILEEIKRLVVENIPDVVYSTTKPKAVEHLPGPSIPGQTTALKTLDKTMSLLYDDRYRVIGIWGLGGVGKTTLVRTLNNQLNNTTLTQLFGIVIWATVSKNWDMKQVQTQIARRLKLEVQTGESVQEIAIRLHQRLMNEEKFLLILDDVWVKIDLDSLGVPQPEVHKGCKIILTSRRKEVCRSMFTDFDVKIDVLNHEEAWQLFCQKAGDVSHMEEIRPFADAIARECCGLPLAINIVGASMRRRTKVELWEYALNELRSSVPSIEDIEDEVYKPLKWSYDSLPGNNIKSCFLYCSLFPEDYTIEIIELVHCWLGEGLIDEQQDHVDRINTGIALIEKLMDSCLLEDGAREGTVKMHDVVRDFAICIASTSEDGCKSLVRSGIGLSEISVGEFSNSKSLKRVSFMKNNITRLPDCVIQCSEASTLLLQGNELLQTIPERFLQGFEALKVLNLSYTTIQSLPPSLLQLRDLRVLQLRDCKYLEELPALGGLSRLQILDLHFSKIRELPKGMENLSNLRQLDLSYTMNLKQFQVSIISRLPCLEVLNMRRIAYYFDGNVAEEEAQTTFKELKHLDRLLILCISFKRIPHLSSEDLAWINRLRGFDILIEPKKEILKGEISTTNDKKVNIYDADISQESIGQLCSIAKSMVLAHCEGLDGKIIDLGINRICHGLKSFELYSMKFNRSSRPNGGLAAHCDLLPNLEKLTLFRLEGLESISDLLGYPGLRFLRLKSVKVDQCYNMKYLFSCGDFIQTLPNLEVIEVWRCRELEELFNYDSGQNMALDPVVPKLRTLELENLPKLRSLCRHEETWPCLEQVDVRKCEQLRRLPLSNQNAGTIKEIGGESEWWDALEWDDDETKSSLLPYFHPARDPNLM